MKQPFLFVSLTCWMLFFSLVSFSPVHNDTSGIIQDILSQTNQYRRSKGLPDLVIRNELNNIAEDHSENMANGSVGFGHRGFDSRTVAAKRKINAVNTFGENVAYGATSGAQVMKMWINSPPHRKNLLGHFKYMGIGIAKNKQGTIFYTQFFAG